MTIDALVIIDVQQAFIDGQIIPPVFQANELILKINNLIRKAREAETPIIFIKHNGPENHPLEKNTPGNEIFRDLNKQNEDTIIEKTTPDSFYKTELDDFLKKESITNLIICGIQTEICIDTTCRSAFSKNYNIILVSDAHSTWDKDDITSMQIINHHNGILGDWFAKLKKEEDILFSK